MSKPLLGYQHLRKGRVSIDHQIYLITTVTHQRSPVFAEYSRACAACRMFSSVLTRDHHTLLCWVLMPDHVHWLLQLGEDGDISKVVGKLKATSAKAVRRLGFAGQVWAAGFHDHALRNDEDLLAVARYVVANPLRAGLVRRVSEYPYWDAVWINN